MRLRIFAFKSKENGISGRTKKNAVGSSHGISNYHIERMLL